MTGCEHESAVKRLESAMEEQARFRARYAAAIGTTAELSAYSRLRAAGEQVAARGAWLRWVDDESYRGLEAGPFSLRAENDARGRSAESVAGTEKAASLRPTAGRP
jgi:hypothetical protein